MKWEKIENSWCNVCVCSCVVWTMQSHWLHVCWLTVGRKEFQRSSEVTRSLPSSPKRLAVVTPKPQSPGESFPSKTDKKNTNLLANARMQICLMRQLNKRTKYQDIFSSHSRKRNIRMWQCPSPWKWFLQDFFHCGPLLFIALFCRLCLLPCCS